MASGVTFRQNRKTVEFLDLIGDSQIISNPPESFKLSETMVNTVIVVVDV